MVKSFRFNPLLPQLMGSIGNHDVWPAQVESDPRYPEWKKEADKEWEKEERDRKEKKREMGKIKAEMLEKYSFPPVTEGEPKYLFSYMLEDTKYNGHYIDIVASSIDEALRIFVEEIKTNKVLQEYGDEIYKLLREEKPTIHNLRTGLVIIRSWGE